MNNSSESLIEFLLDFTGREFDRLKMYKFGLSYGELETFTNAVIPLAGGVCPDLDYMYTTEIAMRFHAVTYPFLVKCCREQRFPPRFADVRQAIRAAYNEAYT